MRAGRHKRGQWLSCTSKSGALRVSPRLASLFMRVVDALDEDGHPCAACTFHIIMECLPVGEFSPMHQPAEFGLGERVGH